MSNVKLQEELDKFRDANIDSGIAIPVLNLMSAFMNYSNDRLDKMSNIIESQAALIVSLRDNLAKQHALYKELSEAVGKDIGALKDCVTRILECAKPDLDS